MKLFYIEMFDTFDFCIILKITWAYIMILISYLLQLKVPVSMEAFISLSKGGATYEGPLSMIQYKVQSTKMILKDPKYLVVEITLKRMFKYHLAATFVPTALLMIVTEITLFVDEKHFEATIMVHLTTMLVMYTLYQGVSASMPKTAYLKFIDIWLLFGLIIPFLTFVVETLLRLLSVDDAETSFSATTGGKFNINQRQIKIFPINGNKKIPEESRRLIKIRKKTKIVLQYAAQTMIPLGTLIFVISYTFLGYTYYWE